MTPNQAIEIIRTCIESETYTLHPHFINRMNQRGLFLPDVLAIIDRPTQIRMQGNDHFDRPRCLISGKLTDQTDAELLAVIEPADDDTFTIFITIYWDN